MVFLWTFQAHKILEGRFKGKYWTGKTNKKVLC
jgi:hypothetical protein